MREHEFEEDLSGLVLFPLQGDEIKVSFDAEWLQSDNLQSIVFQFFCNGMQREESEGTG